MVKRKKTQAVKGSFDNPFAENRKARYSYIILDTFEAGMQLTGTEIKSIRQSQINIAQAFVTVRGQQVYLNNADIAAYKQGNQFNVDPIRRRKLLLHKKEILQLAEADQQKGTTIVPLRVYLKHGFAKVLIGIGKGKNAIDKRQTIKLRDQEREVQRISKIR